MPGASRDHGLKLARSLRYLQDLEGEFRGYVAEADKTIEHERHPQIPTQMVTWITADPPARDPFSLLVGDCLQCLRTALDQLAFELATAFTVPLPDEIEKASEFPIFGDEKGDGSARFNRTRSKGPKAGLPAPGSGLAKTEGMDPQAQSIIEGLQPYHRGQAYTTDPLWRIHELNRIDKHRLLHSTATNQSGTGVRVPSVWGRAFQAGMTPSGVIEAKSGEIHGRTEVAGWPWPVEVPLPANPADIGWGPTLQLTFEKSVPLVGGQAVIPTLGALYNYVVTDVLTPLVGFLK